NATRLASPYPNLALAAAERMGMSNFFMPKFGGPDIADLANRAQHLTYSSQPMRAAFSLRKAGMRVLSGLARVHCPVFIAHGALDRVCPVSNAWAVAHRVGPTDVGLLILSRSGHIVTMDRDRDLLRQAVIQFLQRLVS